MGLPGNGYEWGCGEKEKFLYSECVWWACLAMVMNGVVKVSHFWEKEKFLYSECVWWACLAMVMDGVQGIRWCRDYCHCLHLSTSYNEKNKTNHFVKIVFTRIRNVMGRVQDFKWNCDFCPPFLPPSFTFFLEFLQKRNCFFYFPESLTYPIYEKTRVFACLLTPVCTLLCSSLVSVSLPSAPYKIPISWDWGILLPSLFLQLVWSCHSCVVQWECCVWNFADLGLIKLIIFYMLMTLADLKDLQHGSPKCRICKTLTSN